MRRICHAPLESVISNEVLAASSHGALRGRREVLGEWTKGCVCVCRDNDYAYKRFGCVNSYNIISI